MLSIETRLTIEKAKRNDSTRHKIINEVMTQKSITKYCLTSVTAILCVT